MKRIFSHLLLLTALVSLAACNNQQSSVEEKSNEPATTSSQEAPISSEDPISSSEPEEDIDAGREVINDQLYTDSGLKVYFKAQGARIDKITWGENNKQIAKDGFTVGRCANRIAEGKFSLNGTEYQLTKNNNGNHLHGGGNSWQGPFATSNWTKVSQTASTITYTIHSNDGDEGYPGNFDMTVKYTLRQSGELSIEYTAFSDKDTLCNPTNHLFMDLNASADRSYKNINLWIDADSYTPLNSSSIPTGEIKDVAGTQFDYSTEKEFDGSKSYDDNYVLNGGEEYRKVATMTGTQLGVKVDVYTDRPGLQLYKDGNGNICLETQMFPDMVNHPEFFSYGSTVLHAEEEFYSKTSYVFTSLDLE